MITPFFKLRQDDNAVTIEIRGANANIRDTEIEFFDRTFYFSSTPYFLRLCLTGDVEQNTNSTTKYDADTGTFTVEMPKKVKGEFFPRLDMLSELLKPQRPSTQKPVEEIEENDDQDDEILINQEVPKESKETDEEIRDFGYGFGWQRHGVLSKFGSELSELFDFENADEIKISDRFAKVQENDEREFDSEHYLADLFEESEELTSIKELTIEPSFFNLTDDDRLYMKDLRIVKLPNFPVTVQRQISYSLVDLLFSYLFDLRINDLEHNSVSDVMIGKLSPSLNCLVKFQNAKQSLCAAIRRSLCYSLYRQFDLLKLVSQDLSHLIKNGRSSILHCLLVLRKRFNNSSQEFAYLYNQLFLDNYCIWIQSVDDEILQQLSDDVEQTVKELSRSDIEGLDLDYLESEAKLLMLSVKDGTYDSDDN